MVKNLKGGKGAKNLARKSTIVSTGSYNKVRVSQDPLELYASVVKMLGNGMCYVDTKKHTNLICHIRQKFSGRGKRDNTVINGSIVLVGLREWETTIKNCDLICLYTSADLNSLINQSGFDIILTADQHDKYFNAAIEEEEVEKEVDKSGNNKICTDAVIEPLEDINFDDI
jgi:translation initiation factor IF-1